MRIKPLLICLCFSFHCALACATPQTNTGDFFVPTIMHDDETNLDVVIKVKEKLVRKKLRDRKQVLQAAIAEINAKLDFLDQLP